MAYDDQKILSGRQPVCLIEVDYKACSLTYGSTPCTASGASGEECFNSYATCQDQANYASATKTFRFSSVRMDGIQGTGDAPTFPTVLSIDTAPTTLTPSKGLGIRSSVSITLEDHPWTDIGIDKYVGNRSYDPYSQGSFWGKMTTRWPFYENNEVRVKTGYLDDDGNYDANNFITRTYFLETIKGPTEGGKVTLVAKDILKFADGEKANVPTQSQATLTADIINDLVTSISINDPNDDIYNAHAAGQSYIRIDDETMLITGISGSNPSYTLTVTRAAMPSIYTGTMTAEAHDEEATVQHCHFFDAQEVDDIVYYLLNTGAGINASYLPTSEWQDVIDFGLQNYLFSALITEPTAVKDLLDEVTEHSILIWWDERDQKVKMDSIIRRANDYGPFDDDSHLIAGSVAVARDDKSRFSQCWLHYGHRTPIAELDELKNFSVVKASVDLDAEGANEYNQTKIRKIFSRFLPIDLGSVASEISNRLVINYRDTKAVITFTMDPKDDDAWTGNKVSIQTRQLQDRFGAKATKNYRILQVKEKYGNGSVVYEYAAHSIGGFYDGSDPSIYGLITPDLDPRDGVSAFPDYSSASVELKSQYAFIAADDRGDGNEGFSPNEDPYIII